MPVISHLPFKRTFYKDINVGGNSTFYVPFSETYSMYRVYGKFYQAGNGGTGRYRTWLQLHLSSGSNASMEHNCFVSKGTGSYAIDVGVSNPWFRVAEFVDNGNDTTFDFTVSTRALSGNRPGIIGDLNYTIGSVGASRSTFSSHPTNLNGGIITGLTFDNDQVEGSFTGGYAHYTVEGLLLTSTTYNDAG